MNNNPLAARLRRLQRLQKVVMTAYILVLLAAAGLVMENITAAWILVGVSLPVGAFLIFTVYREEKMTDGR